MVYAERLDPKLFVFSRHASNACLLAIAADRVAETVVHRLGIQQRLNEGLAVANRQRKLLMIFDRTQSCVLHTRQHKIG
jgi:hypothetical protein